MVLFITLSEVVSILEFLNVTCEVRYCLFVCLHVCFLFFQNKLLTLYFQLANCIVVLGRNTNFIDISGDVTSNLSEP